MEPNERVRLEITAHRCYFRHEHGFPEKYLHIAVIFATTPPFRSLGNGQGVFVVRIGYSVPLGRSSAASFRIAYASRPSGGMSFLAAPSPRPLPAADVLRRNKSGYLQSPERNTKFRRSSNPKKPSG